MCLFVYVIDHGVNEGEPVDEQQVNEDQFRDPDPKDGSGVGSGRIPAGFRFAGFGFGFRSSPADLRVRISEIFRVWCGF